MPQVAPAVARARAERLRAAGAAAVAAHLQSLRGARVRLLMERPDLGRTEGFAPARLAAPCEPGAIVEARVTGAAAGALLAVAV
jgi:threonylcarbamoyladenosine tRNA methylthiotransferase MtaB